MTKFLVVATPRSGTAYTAQAFSQFDINCGHEQYCKIETRLEEFLASEEVCGECSWLAVPYLDKLPANVRVLHQARNPLHVIRSLLEIQFLDLDAGGRPRREGLRRGFTEFALKHCPEVLAYNTELERSAWFYYHWNLRIDQRRSEREILRYRLEDLDERLLRTLLTFIGVDASQYDDAQLAARLATIPTNVNTKIHEKVILEEDISWSALPAPVRELAKSYGYTIDQTVAGPTTVSGDTCDQAFERARYELNGAHLAWRGEREQHTRRSSVLQEEVRNYRRLIRELQILLRGARDDAHRVRRELHEVEQRARQREQQLSDDLAQIKQHEQQVSAQLAKTTQEQQRLLDERDELRRDIDQLREAHQQLNDHLVEEQELRQQLEREQQKTREELNAVCRELETERAQLATTAADLQNEQQKAHQLCEQITEREKASQRLEDSLNAERITSTQRLSRIKRLQSRAHDLEDELILRAKEVRYLLGDALVKAARPSKDTIMLPGRMVKLFFQGLRQCRTRRQQDQPLSEHKPVKPVSDKPVPAKPVPDKPEPAKLVTDKPEPAKPVADTMPTVVKPAAAKPIPAQAPEITKPRRQNGPPAVKLPAIATRTNALKEARGYLFFCVNGAGLGHLTRSLAIARRIRRLQPKAPIYFLTSSQALDVISQEGMIAYHIPPYSSFNGQLRSVNEWNRLLLSQIQIIMDTHRPSVLVYDGVFPYSGLLDAIHECGFAHCAMVLRLRHKHNRLLENADKLAAFDQLIFPGEAGVTGDVANLVPRELADFNCRFVEPIVYLDREELLPREEARARWNIPPDKKAVYVQLGAGNINDTGAWLESILTMLSRREDVEIVLAESPISDQGYAPRAGVHILRHYPNSLFYNGFDLAVTAVGYNTFHEQIHFGVPSVLIPNQETQTDDQTLRAMTAHRALAAMTVLRPDDLGDALALTVEVANTMREKALALVPTNGALTAAQCLCAVQPATVVGG
ncbi:MAG: hypothetical protein ABIG44_13115 [Planctomycetota bacterium]